MKLIPVVISILILPSLVCSGESDLPEWGSSSDAAKYTLGGRLWPTGIMAGSPDTSSAKSLLAKYAKIDEKYLASKSTGTLLTNEADSEDAAILLADQMELAGVVIDETEKSDLINIPIEQEQVTEVLPPIEGKLQDDYFAHAPVDFLVDPQHLLTEQKSNDLSRFLEFHSDEANFHIYVLVLGETQQIPKSVSLKNLHNEWFDENPTALMVYYREHPENTQIVFNKSVKSALPKSVFDRILENCLREGASTENAPDQVEKMSVELSIQLYWLTRLIDRQAEMKQKVTVVPVQSGSTTQIVDTLAVESPAVVAALKENNNIPVVTVESVELTSGQLHINWFWTSIVTGIVVFLVASFWSIRCWRRRNGMAGNPMLFPDCEVSHRLGGKFSGGTFVAMSFEIGDAE